MGYEPAPYQIPVRVSSCQQNWYPGALIQTEQSIMSKCLYCKRRYSGDKDECPGCGAPNV